MGLHGLTSITLGVPDVGAVASIGAVDPASLSGTLVLIPIVQIGRRRFGAQVRADREAQQESRCREEAMMLSQRVDQIEAAGKDWRGLGEGISGDVSVGRSPFRVADAHLDLLEGNSRIT